MTFKVAVAELCPFLKPDWQCDKKNNSLTENKNRSFGGRPIAVKVLKSQDILNSGRTKKYHLQKEFGLRALRDG